MIRVVQMHVCFISFGKAGGAEECMIDLIDVLVCMGERVVMLGYRDELYESMFHADASLVCSRCEAFGRVTIEAMKLGRPVIGSNSGGTPELIDDHRTGLLYEPGNASDLTEKIRWMVDRPQDRLLMGANAARYARERFTLERYGHDFAVVLNDVVADDKRIKLD